MLKNKTTYTIIAVVALIIIGVIFWYVQNLANYSPTSSSSTQKTTTPANTAKPQTNALSYGEALKIYATRRIQFSVNSLNSCIMNPSNPVFTKGAAIMADNRYGKQMTIYLDGQVYRINGYGFKIITLTTSFALPHTIKVDCQTGKNNGQITLQ